ncbi:MAG: glycosyltransferase family 2 protein [bacterium]|nr:glycosyltransferase family 2 protein [bacterium]
MIRLIMPAFNEAGPLESLLPRLPASIAGHDVVALVVSDGSTDSTVDVATRHGIATIDLQPNRGKGTAVRAALAEIQDGTADVIVFMDADGQHDPDDLSQLIAPLLDGECDIVVGSRYAADESRGNTPLNRYLIRSGTVSLLSRILGTRFSDPYCGFRAFSPSALATVEFCGSRYEGELEVLFDACRCGLSVVEAPIGRIYGQGTSKMSADGGRLVGRLRVLRQYAGTIVRKSRQLRADKRQTQEKML